MIGEDCRIDLADGSWYPVDKVTLKRAALTGAYYGIETDVESHNICCRCGGLTFDFIEENREVRYGNKTVICICDYGSELRKEKSLRLMSKCVLQFIGRLRSNNYSQTIMLNPKRQKDGIRSSISAFKPYRRVITSEKVAGEVEKLMIELLVGYKNKFLNIINGSIGFTS